MKVNFNYEFKTLDKKVIPEEADKEIVDKDGKKTIKKSPPFKLKKISVDMLLMPDMDKEGKQKEMSGTQKIKRYELAKRIYEAKDSVSLEAEEIVLLKKLIAKGYSTLIVGQAWEILDPHGEAEKETVPKEEPPLETAPEEKNNKDH